MIYGILNEKMYCSEKGIPGSPLAAVFQEEKEKGRTLECEEEKWEVMGEQASGL